MPDLPEAHAAMGHHHMRGERYAEAVEHFDRVIFMERRYGHASGVAGWRANALFNLEDGRAAFREINQLLAQADAEAWIWPWCARLVAAFGRVTPDNAVQAAGFWTRYIREFPEDGAGHRELLLSRLYLRSQGRDIGANYALFCKEFDRQIVHVQGEATALLWDRLGHWAQDDEDWPEAERCFRNAYDLDGGHYGYCLGTALVFQDRFAESLPLLMEQAETLQPDAESWFQLGVAYAGLGRPDDAIAAYNKALDLNPDYALAMFNLGGTHWNAGDHPAAVRIWSAAIARFRVGKGSGHARHRADRQWSSWRSPAAGPPARRLGRVERAIGGRGHFCQQAGTPAFRLAPNLPLCTIATHKLSR